MRLLADLHISSVEDGAIRRRTLPIE